MTVEEIRAIVKGEVSTDEETLTKFSHDASIFEVKPQFVVAPRDAEDIKKLVLYVNAQREKMDSKASITARSAGTCMSGGPLTESIVLDMTKYFNRVLTVDGDYAITEPGVYYRDFDAQTKRVGLFMPSYPASRELATVGGMVANNSGGEKTLSYGKTEDYVMELSVVFADGNEYVVKPISKKELDLKMKLKNFEGKLYAKLFELVTENQKELAGAKPAVSKNSAGYYLWDVWDGETFDMTKLLTGSQGTLGIITRIKFKLVPVKPISKMAVIFLKDLKPLGDVVVEAMKHQPESLESYDDNTLKLAIKFFPGIARSLRKQGQSLFTLAKEFLPEVKMVLTGGMPKLVIFAEFAGTNEVEIDAKLKALGEGIAKLPVKFRLVTSAEESKKYWVIRRESFSLLRNNVKDKHTAPFIDDFCIKPELLPEFLPKLNTILAKYPSLIYTIAGHAGDGNFHIIPLMNLADPAQRMIIPKLSDEVYNLVIEYKGSITAEHNDGLIRSPYLEKMYGKDITDLFTQTKDIFDPQNIFNPGKKVHSSLPFALSHIKKGF